MILTRPLDTGLPPHVGARLPLSWVPFHLLSSTQPIPIPSTCTLTSTITDLVCSEDHMEFAGGPPPPQKGRALQLHFKLPEHGGVSYNYRKQQRYVHHVAPVW